MANWIDRQGRDVIIYKSQHIDRVKKVNKFSVEQFDIWKMNSSFSTYFGKQNPKLRLPKYHQLNDDQTGLVTNRQGLSENPLLFCFIWRVHFMFWSPFSAIWYLAIWVQNIILIELNTEDTLYFFHQLMSNIMLNKILSMVGLKKNTSQVNIHEMRLHAIWFSSIVIDQ